MKHHYAFARKDECHELESLSTREESRGGNTRFRESESCLDWLGSCVLVCCIDSAFRETCSVPDYSGVSIRCILLALDPGLVLRWKQFGLFESVLSAGTVPVQQFFVLTTSLNSIESICI